MTSPPEGYLLAGSQPSIVFKTLSSQWSTIKVGRDDVNKPTHNGPYKYQKERFDYLSRYVYNHSDAAPPKLQLPRIM